MIRILMAVLFALLTFSPAFAVDQPASEASIRELMTITDSKKLVEGTMGQVDAMMQASMQQALAGQPVTPEQQKILDQMRTKMLALLKEQLSWDSLEPMMMDIYQKTFTEQEVQGMVDFYKTDAGKAVIAKMPLVMQHTMQAMQQRMGQMMPKMQQLQQETLAQLKAARKK
ncbi:MAG TPA: DUF2059 domain-containing protein [Gallionellaceae bacterium]|nr:DUF2059 domain-containing protein [Gallionellaceae bacterium]